MGNPRTQCIVFGCRRTTGQALPYPQWICREHWRLVPPRRRRAYLRVRRRLAGGWSPAAARLWRGLARYCFEASAGVRK